MFDELKNQWGFSGFAAKSRATTEFAARQKKLQVSIRGGWADPLRTGYTRITEWLRTTAPQLKYQMTARDQDLASVAPSPA